MKMKIVFLIFLLLFQIIPSSDSKEKFSFHEEISIPFVTEDMVNQPVDIVFHFSNPCWAIDEERHSVRVFYSDGKMEKEIESQIYNLSFTDGEHIKSCNIVFLLQGKGKYFIYYDDEPTSSPNYPDHVSISDASYYYEPIPGYFVDLNYYRIMEDGYCLYGIGQRGTFLGIDMSQKVIKQLNGKKEFNIGNWGQLASFAMFWYEDRDKGTDEKLLSKEILVDGNLMVRVGLVSTSKEGEVRTTSFYTYYYSPDEEKRLIVSVHHEVLKSLSINGIVEEDGMYVYLLTVKGRSASI
ncbi:MAG: carboxypeptidase regulatory-like domain-containing protein, partial [Thermoplasmata archaeon]